MIEKLRDFNADSKFILYMWDSLLNYPQTLEVLDFFDEIFSFDNKDHERNNDIKFLPLFYTKYYEKVDINNTNFKYDILSVCTVHPNRYKVLNKFVNSNLNPRTIYLYNYLHILQYIYNKLFVREFKKSKFKQFHFKPLPLENIIDLMSSSRSILDIPNEHQNGLTICPFIG